jgi:peptidyl-prolyl cis-trans isomerase C
MRILPFLSLGLIAAALFLACKADQGRPGVRPIVQLIPVAARETNDPRATITEAEFRRELAHIRLERDSSANPAPISPELRNALLDRMIDRRLLAMEASSKGVKASSVAVDREITSIRRALPDYERQLVQTYQTEADLRASIEERLTAAQLVKQEAFSQLKVSDEEVEKLWAGLGPEDKQHPARVHAAQIVLRTEEEGRAVAVLLKKRGADFGQIAREKSVSPERERGGDLGWFEAGVMPTVFDEVCFSLKPGEVSDLTASEYGFHIFKVIETESERPLTLEEAKPSLVERIREERARDAEAKYLEALRAKVRIVKNDQLIGQME